MARSEFGSSVGSLLCWAGVVLGLTGMLVRWYESYLIGADVGHIPVSNLYEVFILFSLITAMFYLYYEQHYATRQLGAFVMLVISAAVVFLMWYTVTRDAAEIQPLVPALQSWWMKIQVPANSLATAPSPVGHGGCAYCSSRAATWSTAAVAGSARRRHVKAISVGFAFFTVRPSLAPCGRPSWGGYWSWIRKKRGRCRLAQLCSGAHAPDDGLARRVARGGALVGLW